jgi:hypothetical protein
VITLYCGTGTLSVGVAVGCTLSPTAGQNPIQIVAIEWGDGTGVQNLGAVASTTVAQHTFGTAGTFTVTATVIDTIGQQGKASATIAVVRQVPAVSINGPSTGTVGAPVVFSVSSSSPAGLSISVVVQFGDGSSRTVSGGSTGATKTYDSAGTYTVSATATDAVGTRATDSTTITIVGTPAPPPPSTQRTAVTITQEANAGLSGCAAFIVSAIAATGTAIQSIDVTHSGAQGPWHFNAPAGRIVTCGLTANADILTATATDSAGGVATFQLIVR